MTGLTSANDSRSVLDRLGAVASSVCALHCALCALAPALLTVLGLGSLIGHGAEWGFTIVAAALAVAAAIKEGCACGWRKAPAILFTGVILLVASRFMEEAGLGGAGVLAGLAGGALLVTGHLFNLRVFGASGDGDCCAVPQEES